MTIKYTSVHTYIKCTGTVTYNLLSRCYNSVVTTKLNVIEKKHTSNAPHVNHTQYILVIFLVALLLLFVPEYEHVLLALQFLDQVGIFVH